MTTLLDDTWTSRDFPVLRELVRLMDEQPVGGVRCGQVESALPDLDPADIQRAAVNLGRASLIDLRGASGKRFLFCTDVSERALRLTGLWPDEQAAADHLLWVLEQKATSETATPEERSRWAKIRDSVGHAGRDIAVELAAAVAARSVGA